MCASQKKCQTCTLDQPLQTPLMIFRHYLEGLQVGGIRLLEIVSVVRSVVNDLVEEASCGDRVSSLTISDETDWTVGSGLVKGLTEAGSL